MEEWLSEIRRNTRLRMGLWLIALIIAVYALMALDDMRRAKAAQLTEAQAQLGRMRAIAQQQDWPKRAEAASALRKTLEAKLWSASSKGLAQANFQTWLAEQSTQAGLENTRLSVENTISVPNQPTLWQVSARLEGDFRQPAFDQLLFAFAQTEKQIQVERLEIRKSTNTRFNLVVTGYFHAAQE